MFRRLALALGLLVFLPVAGVAHEGAKCSERDLEQAIWGLGSRKAAKGAVRRMRTRIRLLAQPESMRSIVDATQ